jgi:molybdopterin adenylyltransferase
VIPPAERPGRAAVVTVSTSRAAGEAVDEGGPALASFAESLGLVVAARETVTDERARIEALLRRLVDEDGVDVVLTTGGTGFAPGDVTPEATREVIEREAPGIAEAMRAVSREHTPHWMLSRAVAGIRGTSLIVNLPGNPKAIAETAEALATALPHGLELLRGGAGAH